MIRRLTICATCAGGEAEALASAIGDVPGWELRLHACLSMCDTPTAMAVQGEATYLFAGVTAADAADVRALLAAYAASPAGWIDDARPLGRLRFCLRGRVPG